LKVIFVTPDRVGPAPGGIGGILHALGNRLGRGEYELTAVAPRHHLADAPPVDNPSSIEEIDARTLRRRISNYDPKDTILHFNYPLLHPELILLSPGSIPAIATIHTSAIGELRSLQTVSHDSLTSKDAAFIGTFPLQYFAESRGGGASVLVGVSRSVMNETKASHVRGSNWRWQVVPNGIDLDLFTRRLPGRASDRPILLFVGRHIARKGVADLLRAFGRVRLHSSRPLLVLTGQPSTATHQLVRKYLPPAARADVTIAGFVSRERLAKLLSEATALVFPSHYEGCPLALLEALGAGCPVIGYAIPSVLEIVGEENSGCVLVPPFSVGALCKAIVDLLDSAEQQNKLRAEAVHKARSSFDIERVATSYRSLYAAALEGG